MPSYPTVPVRILRPVASSPGAPPTGSELAYVAQGRLIRQGQLDSVDSEGVEIPLGTQVLELMAYDPAIDTTYQVEILDSRYNVEGSRRKAPLGIAGEYFISAAS